MHEEEAPVNIIMVASFRARNGSDSNLLRLVRDHVGILKKYTVYTTNGTGTAILGTGFFDEAHIKRVRSGRDGGVAQLAAMVARGEALACILLLDPSDPWSDAVENRALRRVCIQLQVRLITTYAAAVRWLNLEAGEDAVTETAEQARGASEERAEGSPRGDLTDEKEGGLRVWALSQGISNVSCSGEPIQLPVQKRTLGLISHDKKKHEMVLFASAYADIISKHQRILTTGTTGTLLKLLFSNRKTEEQLMRKVASWGLKTRMRLVLKDVITALKEFSEEELSLEDLLEIVRKATRIKRAQKLAEKIVPFPSGPLGGDVLIADAVLKNQCHSIVFFHDPSTAHPHNDDIRLLEHTAQLPDVFTECVSDKASAENWAKGLRSEATLSRGWFNLAQEIRARCLEFGIHEVLLLTRGDDCDGPDLGHEIARGTAGYFHQRLLEEFRKKKSLRIGIAWGWGAKEVLRALRSLAERKLIEVPFRMPDSVVWSPLIGNINAELTDREANIIAQDFAHFYGGAVDAFPCGGFSLKGADLPPAASSLISCLERAEIVLTAAAPWNSDAALIKETGLSKEYFPDFEDAVGLISGVFLKADGEEARGNYTIIGLGYDGFRIAAQRNSVILMCGGEERRRILLAAVRAKLVSSLVTTTGTAEWLLNHLPNARNSAPREAESM